MAGHSAVTLKSRTLQTTTAAKKSQDKGFNEWYNGFARVINLCTFLSQPVNIFLLELNASLTNLAVASIYRQTSGKILKIK